MKSPQSTQALSGTTLAAWAVGEVLARHPGLAIVPGVRGLVLRGTLRCWASGVDDYVVDETFQLEVLVPREFPMRLPRVYETVGESRGRSTVLRITPCVLGQVWRCAWPWAAHRHSWGFSTGSLYPTSTASCTSKQRGVCRLVSSPMALRGSKMMSDICSTCHRIRTHWECSCLQDNAVGLRTSAHVRAEAGDAWGDAMDTGSMSCDPT